MAFLLDRFCDGLGIRPVGVKLYAIKAAHLAGAVVGSSVFSSQQAKNMRHAFDYGSFLKACIGVSESPGLISKTDAEILGEIQNLNQSNSNLGDLIEVMEMGEEFLSSLEEWQVNLAEVCLEVVNDRLGNENRVQSLKDTMKMLEEEPDFDIGEGATVKSSYKSASERLEELRNLRHAGEITSAEYTAKRNQIINEI